PHGELVEVRLAEDRHAGGTQVTHQCRVIGRDPPLEDLRAGGGDLALGDHDVLDRDRDAGELVQVLAGGAAGVDVGRGGQRLLGVDVEVGVDRGVDLCRAVQVRLGDLDGGGLAAAEQVRQVGGAAVGQARLGHSQASSPRICGTANIPS